MFKALRSYNSSLRENTKEDSDFYLKEDVVGMIDRVFVDIKSRFELNQRMIVIAVLADMATKNNNKKSKVILNLKNIIEISKSSLVDLSVQYLLNLSIIQKTNSKTENESLESYELINKKTQDNICEFIEKSLEVKKYSSVVDIIKAASGSNVWVDVPSTYLGKNQLEGLILEYKDLLNLNLKEKRFLLESAIYSKSDHVLDFAEIYTFQNTFGVIKRFLYSKDVKIRLRSVQAIQILGDKITHKQEVGDMLYARAMEDSSAAVRRHCSLALTKYYRPIHLEKLKYETRNIRLGLKQFSYQFVALIYSWLLYKPKDIFRSISKEDRALDILILFYATKIDISEFRRIVRQKASILWRRRQIINVRVHLLDWMHQGRLIGLSGALGWFVTTGSLLLLTIKNIYLSGVSISATMSVFIIAPLLLTVVVMGIFWGRSISKTAFVRHTLYRENSGYKYILHNPLYKIVLIALAIGTIFLGRDYDHYTVAFSIVGLLGFWLMIPLLFHIFNLVKKLHRATLRGKSFIGSLIIFISAFTVGDVLANKHNDVQFFYFFFGLGAIVSMIFGIIYFSSNMSIERHSIKKYKHSNDIYLLYRTHIFNFILVVSSVLLTGCLLVNAYGLEAVTGKNYAKHLSNDAGSTLYYVKDENEYGPGDVNYYHFDPLDDQLTLMTVPSNKEIMLKQDAILIFDKTEKVDFSYYSGESYIVPPGPHFITAYSKKDFYNSQKKPLSFAFNIEKIPYFISTFENENKSKENIENVLLEDFSVGRITWIRSHDNTYWVSKISGKTNKNRNYKQLRILKNIYNYNIKNSVNATVYTTHPSKAKSHINLYIQKTDQITHVPVEKFYYDSLSDFDVKLDGDQWTLELYLFSPDIDISSDILETVAFIDISSPP